MLNDYETVEASLPSEAVLAMPDLPFVHIASGKVREIYEVDERTLLIIATDRLSAFDVIMKQGIPGKGIILNQLSLAWFDRVQGFVDHHLVDDHTNRVEQLLVDFPELVGRSMLVDRLTPLPIEAIVRGHLAGSGLKIYKETGQLQGHLLPDGLVEGSKLPEPLFTPSTKAKADGHDMPITCKAAQELLGDEYYEVVEEASFRIYEFGVKYAAQAGLILADTKFEFGLTSDGKVKLMDEILTPDSSRYWPEDKFEPGRPQHAFDKQYIRDFLENTGWDKLPPPPEIPLEVLSETREKYLQALKALLKSS